MSSLSCEELVEFLDDYVEGRLEPGALERFEAHLKVCGPCLAYLSEYRKSIDMVRGLRPADGQIPTDVPPSLIHAVKDALRKP